MLLCPTLLLIALLIYTTGGSPVFTTDELPNLDGTVARRLRFRTTGDGTAFFRGLGKLLRAYSVDQWVALLNVARGDVSLREFLSTVSSRA